MKIAVLALTKEGTKKAREVAEILLAKGDQVELLLPRKFNLESKNKESYFNTEDLSQVILKAWQENQALVFIMALGIVVRKIALLIQNKTVDPAVLVLDERGDFIISVLSGHLGGANQLTEELAKALEATPVITTATDVQGKPAFDLLAKRFDLLIENVTQLKRANGALVNGEELDLVIDSGLKDFLTSEAFPSEVKINRLNFTEVNSKLSYAQWNTNKNKVLITNKILPNGWPLQGDLLLRPKNLYIGIGCRRGVSFEVLKEVLMEVLLKNNLSMASIKALASVDIKQDEEGLLRLAEELNLPLKFFSREEITRFQEAQKDINFSHSAFVEKEIGVGGVCEPVALMIQKQTKLLQPKVGQKGVTIAIAEASYGWWELDPVI